MIHAYYGDGKGKSTVYRIVSELVLEGSLKKIAENYAAVKAQMKGSLNFQDVMAQSQYNNLLEYPQYTRPAEFRGMCVPEPLLNGNHKEIREWRLRMAEEKTKEMRPEMYERYSMLKQAEEELKKKSKRKRNRETDAPPEPEIPSESLLKD